VSLQCLGVLWCFEVSCSEKWDRLMISIALMMERERHAHNHTHKNIIHAQVLARSAGAGRPKEPFRENTNRKYLIGHAYFHIYIYIYVYIHIQIYIYIYINIHTCIHTHIRTYTQLFMYVYAHTYAHTNTHVKYEPVGKRRHSVNSDASVIQ